nr:hypothetical protein [Tanacetum cinerariifolium]
METLPTLPEATSLIERESNDELGVTLARASVGMAGFVLVPEVGSDLPSLYRATGCAPSCANTKQLLSPHTAIPTDARAKVTPSSSLDSLSIRDVASGNVGNVSISGIPKLFKILHGVYQVVPPSCETCKIFDHVDANCPKKTKVVTPGPVDNDGFVQVTKKQNKAAVKPRQIAGVHLTTDLEDDEDDVEEAYVEADPRTQGLSKNEMAKGASTPSEEWTSNGVACVQGSQIILGWNPDVVVISFDAQVMHICVSFKADKKDLFCLLIYAHSRYQHRRVLWQNLNTHKHYVCDRPWCLLGDFNVSLCIDDKSVGSSYVDTTMRDFQECVKDIEKLLHQQGNIFENVKSLRYELDEVQRALDSDPSNSILREEEAAYLKAFNDATLIEDQFLCQKAKVDWLRAGDANTGYFHKVVKSQASRNRNDSVMTSNGNCVDSDQVPLAFIDHYTAFLGQQGVTFPFNSNDLFCNHLSSIIANHMVATPVKINDYRPISCYNVLFKCISWIMECVTSTCFSISFNGMLHGYFKGKIGRCQEFKNASGLTPSLPKSTAYFCNVLNYVKIEILSVLPFEEGKLPVWMHLKSFIASCYFIWQERNNRLFVKQRRSKDQVIDVIKSTIRLKLLTCKFKKSKNVQLYLHRVLRRQSQLAYFTPSGLLAARWRCFLLLQVVLSYWCYWFCN